MVDLAELVAGRFELIAPVGRGGSGTVYRARDRASGQLVAVKMVDPDAQGRARFAREAHALAALAAPGIVRYIDHGEHGDRLYLVEEWLDGESLRARIASDGVTAGDAVRVVRAAARALMSAHAAGIVHRDIKPDHLWLVGGDVDRVTVIDFGIARSSRDPRVTTTGRAIGTPSYMAPEQARGVTHLDARVDVFALGVVLYEALAGTPAFAGRSDGAIRAKVVLVEPASLATRCPEASPRLIALVAAMLAKNPALRPRDAAQVAAALEGISVGDGPRRKLMSMQATTTVPSAPAMPGPHGSDAETTHDASRTVTSEVDPAPQGFVLATGPVTGTADQLGALAGAPVELVEGGLWLGVLPPGSSASRASDVAGRWLAALGAPVAVAAIVDGIDAAVEHAADALERAALLAEFADLTGAGPRILFDPVTTALLDGRATGT